MPGCPIVAFEICFLLGLAGLDLCQGDALFLGPGHQRGTDIFGAVAGSNHHRLTNGKGGLNGNRRASLVILSSLSQAAQRTRFSGACNDWSSARVASGADPRLYHDVPTDTQSIHLSSHKTINCLLRCVNNRLIFVERSIEHHADPCLCLYGPNQ